MKKDDQISEELEPFFAAARSEKAELGEDLMARILGDAAQMSAPVTSTGPVRSKGLAGWIAERWKEFGGWQPAAAVLASGILGVWIGYAPPDGMQTTFDQLVYGAELDEDALDEEIFVNILEES